MSWRGWVHVYLNGLDVPREFGELEMNEELEDIASSAIHLYTNSRQIESSDQSSSRLFFPWLRFLSVVPWMAPL
jgi:hypothetical protein